MGRFEASGLVVSSTQPKREAARAAAPRPLADRTWKASGAAPRLRATRWADITRGAVWLSGSAADPSDGTGVAHSCAEQPPAAPRRQSSLDPAAAIRDACDAGRIPARAAAAAAAEPLPWQHLPRARVVRWQ